MIGQPAVALPALRPPVRSPAVVPTSVARPRRTGVNSRYNTTAGPNVVASMAALFTTCMAALQPGGEAFGNQVLNLDAKASGSYFIYLCSGPSREGDFEKQIKGLNASEVYVVNVDIERGGYEHDLSSPLVAARLVELAKSKDCLGVLVTTPCSTWTAARFVQPGPEPQRNTIHPEGIPDALGRIPISCAKANMIAKHAIQICDAVVEHGGHFIWENPVGRDISSQFAIPGRELHASLWTLPIMIEFAMKHGNLTVHFDQCRTNASTQKTTQLLCSASVINQVKTELGNLVCNHSSGTHASIVGQGQNAEGGYATKVAEHFTPDLNHRLAKAMTSVKPQVGWIDNLYQHIGLHTNKKVDAVAYTATVAIISNKINEEDPMSLLSGIASLYSELNDAERKGVDLSEVCHMAAAFVGDGPSSLWMDVFALSEVKRGNSDTPYYKQAMAGSERIFWQEACDTEMASLERNQIFIEVPVDSLPSWNPITRKASELVDIMWVLKKKFNELRVLIKFKARATIRGDLEVKVDNSLGLEPAATFAPTMRHNTFKLLNAAAVVRSAKREKQSGTKSTNALRVRSFDVTSAFLQGKPDTGRDRFVRPPEGYRKYDRRGIPIVWKMNGNCYGRTVAPRIWNQTLHDFLVADCVSGGMGLTQSDFDPCYYFKIYADETRLDMGVYVDDKWVIDDGGPQVDADMALLAKRFLITVDDNPKHFLGMNVIVESKTRVKITSEAYILTMADRYLPTWREHKKVTMPCNEALMVAYEKAHAREVIPPKDQVKRYGSKVGALVYTSPCVRVDAAYAISRLSRALTFPTDDMEMLADQVIIYLAQTASLGVTFDGHAPGGDVMFAESDSDWAMGHSTTGWAIYLAGAAVAYNSKRQACIAMSSTEAEIIAASACALEVKHFRELLTEMGLPMMEPTKLYVDNSGAVELSRDRKSCHRSRHVDRRYFKVRELEFEGVLRVEHIDTKENSSDILTKALPVDAFFKHSTRLLNVKRIESNMG